MLTPNSLPRAQEVKEEPFFKGLDWQMVFLQKVRGVGHGTGHRKGYRAQAATPLKPLSCPQYPPPLIPPRGEVNAADAFDIGSFDEEDTKGIKVAGRRG